MAQGKAVRNTILLRLPDTEFEALLPHLRFVPLELSTCLQRENECIDTVYCMNRGIASMLVETDDGRRVEVGVSGREDMIGLRLAAVIDSYPHSVIGEVPGDGVDVEAA